MKTAPPKIENLPKWAQDHIGVLNTRLNEARAELNRLGEGQPTKVIVDPYAEMRMAGAKPLYLTENSLVRFIVGEGREQYIDVSLDKQGAGVSVRGGTTVTVTPRASNSVTLDVPER